MPISWTEKARAAMKAKGLAIYDVAAELELTPSAVGHYLNGRRQPRIEQIKVIARLLGMSVSELVGEDAYFLVEDKERELIDAFRKLADQDKETAKRLLESLTPPKD